MSWWDELWGNNGSSGGSGESDSGGSSGSSGNTGDTGTDWGGIVNDVGGLVGELFGGDFWDWINDLGCLSSDFKLAFLKDRFPQNIDKMRSLSGVDVSMSDTNVNDFSKRLYHIYFFMGAFKDGNSCKHRYYQKYYEMVESYINALHSLLLESGFVSKGWGVAQQWSQPEVVNNYGFGHPMSFQFRTYEYTAANDTSPYDYGMIGGGYEGGNVLPTVQNVPLMNWGIGLTLGWMAFTYARDNNMLKQFGINKKRKR